MKNSELGKRFQLFIRLSITLSLNNHYSSLKLMTNSLTANKRMNKIINSNKKEAEKLKRVLTQYKPKFDEVALCNAIMKDGKNETDKYSYQLLEA